MTVRWAHPALFSSHDQPPGSRLRVGSELVFPRGAQQTGAGGKRRAMPHRGFRTRMRNPDVKGWRQWKSTLCIDLEIPLEWKKAVVEWDAWNRGHGGGCSLNTSLWARFDDRHDGGEAPCWRGDTKFRSQGVRDYPHGDWSFLPLLMMSSGRKQNEALRIFFFF